MPGAAVALLREGRLDWAAGFGLRELGRPEPVDTDTVFEAASMSKPLFAYLFLQQVRASRFDLDRPVMAVLPEVFQPPQAWQARITPRMLLAHSSGLPNWRSGEDEREGRLRIEQEPGLGFLYSGEGYFYLQRALEHVCGESLQQLARRQLFEPLGMAGSSFLLDREALRERRARGHDEHGQPLPWSDYREANAAYTLFTTAADYARFLAELMRQPQDFQALLLSPQISVSSRPPITRPGLARSAALGAVSWSLGWGLNRSEAGNIAYHTGTNSSGFRNYGQFSTRSRSGLVFMSNSLAGNRIWERLVAAMGDL